MSDLKYQSSEWVRLAKEMHEDENSKSIMDEFKKYNFTQVNKALQNKNYAPQQSFSSDTEWTTCFKKQGLPSHSTEYVYVEESKEDGTCTIDGLCPKEWGRKNN
jgi:hypothetical protein|tara:strand:- start:206 stop:517 length:312 start_codon:yes stop_codon:yes gene_type:complete